MHGYVQVHPGFGAGHTDEELAELEMEHTCFTDAVLHIAKHGLETFELSRHQLYEQAFGGSAPWMDAAAGGRKPFTHGVLHTGAWPINRPLITMHD